MTNQNPLSAPDTWNVVAQDYSTDLRPTFELYSADALALAELPRRARVIDGSQLDEFTMKRRTLVIITLLACSAAVQACGKPCAPCAPAVLLREPLEPLSEDHEVSLFSEVMPRCDFQEVAVIRITTVGWPRSSTKDVYVQHLKKAARARGGDGVIGIRSGEDESTALTGTIVRFRDPDCRQ